MSSLRAENVDSEVADVTAIVKYIRKSVFGTKPPPPPAKFLFGGAMHSVSPALPHIHCHLKTLCLSFLVCYVHIAFGTI